MIWTYTDEQLRDARDAIKRATLYDAGGDRNRPVDPEAHLDAIARAMLVAVGPSIAAQAWDEGFMERARRDLHYGSNDPLPPHPSLNPYRENGPR